MRAGRFDASRRADGVGPLADEYFAVRAAPRRAIALLIDLCGFIAGVLGE